MTELLHYIHSNIIFEDAKQKNHFVKSMYNTCPHLCKYCYANINHAETLKNYKLHDKNSPILTGEITKEDIIQEGNQTSFIIKDNNLSLFGEKDF